MKLRILLHIFDHLSYIKLQLPSCFMAFSFKVFISHPESVARWHKSGEYFDTRCERWREGAGRCRFTSHLQAFLRQDRRFVFRVGTISAEASWTLLMKRFMWMKRYEMQTRKQTRRKLRFDGCQSLSRSQGESNVRQLYLAKDTVSCPRSDLAGSPAYLMPPGWYFVCIKRFAMVFFRSLHNINTHSRSLLCFMVGAM